MWLTDARVVDVVTGTIRDGVSVEISGGRIGAIQSGPGAGEQLSLDGRYLLPGLISVHTHLSVVYPFSAYDLAENPGLTVLRSYQRAQDALAAGVTTIRCVHELNRADLLLAEAARAGWADVPRIVGAGRAISTTGGHGDGHGSALADGPEAFREAALAELDAGCSHIKVFITGGIANLGETFDTPEMSLAEMQATVGAAAERDTYVVAHAGSSLAIKPGAGRRRPLLRARLRPGRRDRRPDGGGGSVLNSHPLCDPFAGVDALQGIRRVPDRDLP